MENTKFIAIAAVSTNGVIGIDNEIPWRIPEDFKHFRETTMGHAVLVGYNTYLTLPRKAFEGRKYIVLNDAKAADVTVSYNTYEFNGLENALKYIKSDLFRDDKVFVAGGAMIYQSMIDNCDEAIISWVNKDIQNGNKLFPIDKLFANFTAVDDSGWIMSKTGIEYKIRKYVKS